MDNQSIKLGLITIGGGNMGDGSIKVNDHGPYIVTGMFEVVDAKGNVFETKRVVSLCRCGHSAKKPFCDGAHRKLNFKSAPRADI